MSMFRKLGTTGLALFLAGCTTTPNSSKTKTNETDTTSVSEPSNQAETADNPLPADSIPESNTESEAGPDTELGAETEINTGPETNSPGSTDTSGTKPMPSISISQAYAEIPGWGQVDLTGALKSFQNGCAKLVIKDDNAPMHARSEFGRVSDWRNACNTAMATPAFSTSARDFFENEFLPVNMIDNMSGSGMLTGYYQPEIQASRVKTDVFSEPILKAPSDPAKLNLPRSQINESTSEVMAYGRPIEVFFMQIQGSGVLAFDTGEKVRAAYDANNGKAYTSIGRILVERGAFTLEQASKQAIENWMAQNGPQATKDLMNENARYIFFKEEVILPGEGPKGAMRVPLTDMASIAIDPSYYPYGVPVWLDTTLPQTGGDYHGAAQQILAMTQDTGKAIRGRFRADLYFGSGDLAGSMAGVMKHSAQWTVLLPTGLALSLRPIS